MNKAIPSEIRAPVVKAMQNIKKHVSIYTAFISGSLTEGFANVGSDIDLYVVTESNTEADLFKGVSALWPIEGKVVNVTILLLDQIRLLEEKLRNFVHEPFIGTAIQEKDVLILHRISNGWWVLNSRSFLGLLSPRSLGSFRTGVALDRIQRSHGAASDLCGMLVSRDYVSLPFSSSEALSLSLESALFATGNSIGRRKWLLRMTVKIFGARSPLVSALLDGYGSVRFAGFVEAKSHVDSVLALRGKLSDIILTEIVFGQQAIELYREDLHSWINARSKTRKLAWRRLGSAVVVYTRSEFVLRSDARRFVVQPDFVAIWVVIDGCRTVAEVEKRIRKRVLLGSARISTVDIKSAIFEMEKMGILKKTVQ